MENQGKTVVLIISIILAGLIGVAAFWFGSNLGKKGEPLPANQTTDQQLTPDNSSDLESNNQADFDQNDQTDPVDNTEPASQTTEEKSNEEPEGESDIESEEEIPEELIIPDLEGLKEYLPEGGNLVYYWYAKMNDDEYNEYIITYNHQDQAKVMALGVEKNAYRILWDQEIPGNRVNGQRVEIRDRTQNGTHELVIGTNAFMNIYQYSDEGPVNLVLNNGPRHGENTQIALGTPLTADVELGDSRENGLDEIRFISAPDENNQQMMDIYEWDGEQYSFVETITRAQ